MAQQVTEVVEVGPTPANEACVNSGAGVRPVCHAGPGAAFASVSTAA
jgi:hypothetical protein